MKNRREHLRLLAAYLGGQDSDGKDHPTGLPTLEIGALADIDVFATASSEAILPALYPRLQALHLLDQVPTEVVDALAAATELNRERNQVILSQAHTVVALLNNAGIEPIALKGLAYILTGIYLDPGTRYLIDLDFLIPEHQIATAIQVLADVGYTAYADDQVAAFRHHAPPMLRTNCVQIELHHSLGLGVCSDILPASEIIAASQPYDWNGARLRIPSPDHLVTHLILHSQIRHPYCERIWPPLRALYDLLLLTRHYATSLNWPSIRQRFRASGQQTTLYLHLLQVEQTLAMPRPFPIVLTATEQFRWLRRKALDRWPSLRFIDPIYLALSTLSRRFRLLRSMLIVPGGWKHATQMFLNPAFYRRLISEITLSRQ